MGDPFLIRRMARENNWGAPRIHAELPQIRLPTRRANGFTFLPKRAASPDKLKGWLAFLRKHRDGEVGQTHCRRVGSCS